MTDLICMGEPMLELNQRPPGASGERTFLQGHGGDTSNAAIAASRQGVRVAYLTALGLPRRRDWAGDDVLLLAEDDYLWRPESLVALVDARRHRRQAAVRRRCRRERSRSRPTRRSIAAPASRRLAR